MSSGLVFKKSYLNSLVPFFFVYSKVLNIRCSVETLRTIEKQFFSKNIPELKIANFPITMGHQNISFVS